MKLFLLHLFFVSFLFAQTKPSDEIEIMKVVRLQEAAWNKGDIEGYMFGYWKSDSLKFIGSKGIQHGWEKTLANYKKSYPNKEAMGILSLEVISLKVFDGESAFMLGSWKLKREVGDLSGYFTLLWRNINDEWKVVIDHSS